MTFQRNLPFNCATEIVDPTSRYLLLQGILWVQEVTLVGYYAPNNYQLRFFSHLLQVLTGH